jgi:hypothetical protein
MPEYPKEDWMKQLGQESGSRKKFAQANGKEEKPMTHEELADYIREHGEVHSHVEDEYLKGFIKKLPDDMEVIQSHPQPDLTTVRIKKALTS